MSTDEAEVRRASIDPERLLPGEHPSHPAPGDSQHWVGVYTELLETKRRLVSDLRKMMALQSRDAQDELERADVNMLELQILRFEYRRGVWLQQLEAEEPRAR